MHRYLVVLLISLMFPGPAQAAEPAPGENCTPSNATTASADGTGGHFMICEGGTWKAVYSYNTAGNLTKIGNQSCANGQILKFNGSIWACAADGGGSSLWTDGGSGKIYYNGGAIGIGTNNPDSIITIVNNGTGDNTRDDFSIFSYGTTSPGFLGSRANGSLTAPQPVIAGDLLSTYSGFGYTGSAFVRGTSLIMAAENNWTTSPATHNGAFAFHTTRGGVDSERLRIASDGKVGIGTSAPTTMLTVDPPNGVLSTTLPAGWGGGVHTWDVYANGSVGIGTGGHLAAILTMPNGSTVDAKNDCPSGWTCTGYFWDVSLSSLYYNGLAQRSDLRLKKNIRPLTETDSLERLYALNPVQYEWRDEKIGAGPQYGFIAQEVEKTWPELVLTADDAQGTKSVNYMNLIAPLIEAVQQLKAGNDKLRTEFETYRKENSTATPSPP
jgi:hypothetical protein